MPAIFGRKGTEFSGFPKDIKEVVLGGKLNSLVYAYLHSLPIIILNAEPPVWIFKIDEPLPERISRGCKTYADIWHRLIFEMSVCGRVLFADLAQRARIDENKRQVKLSLKGGSVKFNVNRVHVGDSENITGLPRPSSVKNVNKFAVYDWFGGYLRRGRRGEEIFETGENIPKKLVFYQSIGPNVSFSTDLCSISHMHRKQVYDPDFSIQAMRKGLQQIIHKNGLTNARWPSAVEMTIFQRNIAPLRIEERESTEFVQIIPNTLQEICNEAPIRKFKGEYIDDFLKMLWRVDG